MINIDQLLESVDLDFEPRWVTKSKNGYVEIWSDEPTVGATTWYHSSDDTIYQSICRLKLSEFEDKDWTECIYEVPRKITGKIERFVIENDRCGNVEWWDVVKKINELVDMVNNIVSVQEKMIDSRFIVDTVNELKGAKNE